MTYDPKVAHDFDVSPGEATDGSASFDVACYFDGTHVVGHNSVAAGAPPVVTSGLNLLDAPGVDARFTGPLMDMTLASNAPGGGQAETNGTVHLVVRFPKGAVGRQEPLLTTGHTGEGDFVYVSYEDSGHVRIGFDHWGYGGNVSAPIAVDYGVPHEIWISMGSLFPKFDDEKAWRSLDPAVRQRLRSRVEVVMDGESVLSAEAATHPTTPAEITVARNNIGGSTCGPVFTGGVVFVERMGPVPSPGRPLAPN